MNILFPAPQKGEQTTSSPVFCDLRTGASQPGWGLSPSPDAQVQVSLSGGELGTGKNCKEGAFRDLSFLLVLRSVLGPDFSTFRKIDPQR